MECSEYSLSHCAVEGVIMNNALNRFYGLAGLDQQDGGVPSEMEQED